MEGEVFEFEGSWTGSLEREYDYRGCCVDKVVTVRTLGFGSDGGLGDLSPVGVFRCLVKFLVNTQLAKSFRSTRGDWLYFGSRGDRWKGFVFSLYSQISLSC